MALAGVPPDAAEADRIVDALGGALADDSASLLSMTAGRTMGGHEDYTFTHMVNVTILTLAQGHHFGLDGALLRAFGTAALLHDIGKVRTPPAILHKPDRLTADEFTVMKRHVIDGAAILQRTPGLAPLAAVVAFEHHLKEDMSGYPEGVPARQLNVCTMMVTIADVFDALRSHRPYRQGLATSRVRAIMSEPGGPAFNRPLLMRFVALMGLFPVGTLVRLQSGELAVVSAERSDDPLHPDVRIVATASGELVDSQVAVPARACGDDRAISREIRSAVDPSTLAIDPSRYL